MKRSVRMASHEGVEQVELYSHVARMDRAVRIERGDITGLDDDEVSLLRGLPTREGGGSR